jgi:hypothetical protein
VFSISSVVNPPRPGKVRSDGPTPTVNGPLDSTSIIERIFAVGTAGRCGATITDVTRRRRDLSLQGWRSQLIARVGRRALLAETQSE